MQHTVLGKMRDVGSRRSGWIILISALFVMLAGYGLTPPLPQPPPGAHNPNFRWCLNTANVFPVYGPPNADGVVYGDMGWTEATRYVADNGSNAPDVVMQAIKDATNVYLSFEVSGDATLDKYDAIAIGIDPNGAANNYRRIHIFPMPAAPSPSATSIALTPKYWTGNYANSTWTWTPAGAPVGVLAKASWATASPNSTWNVEVVLPISAFGLTPATYFGLWLDVFKTDTTNFSFTESPWPPAAKLQGGGTPYTDLETATPAPSQWGNATIGGAAGNGVYIHTEDISTNFGSTVISLNQSNTFTANIHNTSLDAAGAPKAANSVTAMFRIRNIGLPSPYSLWDPIPATSGTNPTAAVSIPAAAGGTPGSATRTIGWTLNAAQQSQYSMNIAQCIIVELDSSSPDTLFIQKSAHQNMYFATTNSPFEREATIGTAGYKLAPGRKTLDFLLSEKRYNTPLEAPWKSEIRGLTPAGQGRYTLSAEPGKEVPIRTIVTPPSIKIPSKFLAAKPGSYRNQLRQEVRPGDVLTILAQGSIRLRNAKEGPLAYVGPNGIDLSREGTTGKYLLPREKAPWQSAGALIGSWDGFEKSSFLIGSARSLKVPRNARLLSLAINDTEEAYRQQGGDGFKIQIVETPVEKYYTLSSLVSRDPGFSDLRLPMGINLPTWILCGRRKTGEVVVIQGQKFERTEDVGCFGYILTKIGQQ